MRLEKKIEDILSDTFERSHMVVAICPPSPTSHKKVFFSESLKATLISLHERPSCGAIYNLAGQVVINWRPRAVAHSNATWYTNTFVAKSIIRVGILRVPQRARGAFAKSFGIILIG